VSIECTGANGRWLPPNHRRCLFMYTVAHSVVMNIWTEDHLGVARDAGTRSAGNVSRSAVLTPELARTEGYRAINTSAWKTSTDFGNGDRGGFNTPKPVWP
jgi:hypothetical protein